MKNNSYIKIASIYVGTIIGAGFASGQEIMNFFGKFGVNGLIGILIATVLFCLIGSIILVTAHRNKISTYNEMLEAIFGKNISNVIDFLIILFLIAGYCIMLAGSGAIFHEQYNINSNVGIIFMAIATFITFIFSVKGLSTVNTVIVPFLLISIVYIGTKVILHEGIDMNSLNYINTNNNHTFIISSVTYVGYNMIPALVILTSVGSLVDSKKTAIKGGMLGGLFLGILALFILIPSLILYNDVSSLELPMLNISSYSDYRGKYLYSIILWFAMFTTAIGNGFGFITRISPIFKIEQKKLCFLFCLISIFLAKFGFSNLIMILYPLFGYISFLIIICAFLKLIFKRNAI
ncbi:YkvI family membrane protein [Tepidibacter mesophilus]|uniref:YkvI family membrane protein n=1 Tax=Tepidibacter mesophilus TaxID=655607 RepID=UPI000C084287|nr:GerAB/ArcD/ProY family transporter [Tepidibacter mesophilus]